MVTVSGRKIYAHVKLAGRSKLIITIHVVLSLVFLSGKAEVQLVMDEKAVHDAMIVIICTE